MGTGDEAADRLLRARLFVLLATFPVQSVCLLWLRFILIDYSVRGSVSTISVRNAFTQLPEFRNRLRPATFSKTELGIRSPSQSTSIQDIEILRPCDHHDCEW